MDSQECLPPMLVGDNLDQQLRMSPEYSSSIIYEDKATRLMSLDNLYNIFIPTNMAREIYCKMYLACHRALQRKNSIDAIRQGYENRKRMERRTYNSILGGIDAFSIVGPSGIGKTSAIDRAVSLLSREPIQKGGSTFIPCITVQTPADTSMKALLLNILAELDNSIGSDYYQQVMKKSIVTTDVLIGHVSQVLMNCTCLLVLDEIQNLVYNKSGNTMVGTLTQFINSCGLSVCLVGTPEVQPFFQQKFMLARRTVGLEYNALDFNDEFRKLCLEMLFRCYVRHSPTINDELLLWLYNHSGGNISIVTTLIHDAQEIAITNDYERLDIVSLQNAFDNRLKALHKYVNPLGIFWAKPTSSSIAQDNSDILDNAILNSSLIIDTMQSAKTSGKPILDLLSKKVKMQVIDCD